MLSAANFTQKPEMIYFVCNLQFRFTHCNPKLFTPKQQNVHCASSQASPPFSRLKKINLGVSKSSTGRPQSNQDFCRPGRNCFLQMDVCVGVEVV